LQPKFPGGWSGIKSVNKNIAFFKISAKKKKTKLHGLAFCMQGSADFLQMPAVARSSSWVSVGRETADEQLCQPQVHGVERIHSKRCSSQVAEHHCSLSSSKREECMEHVVERGGKYS